MSLSNERFSILSLLAKDLIEAAQMGTGTIHILSGLPGIGKTHSVNTYLRSRVAQSGLHLCLLNCYNARDTVLALQCKPQTVYVLDEFDTIFSAIDGGKLAELSAFEAFLSTGPILGLMNDFTAGLRLQVTSLVKREVKLNVHSFPSPSTDELEAISYALFQDAHLIVSDVKVHKFLASQIANQRNGDIRTLVRTVQILQLLKDSSSNSAQEATDKVHLQDAHRALHQVLQRDMAAPALKLSELEAGILSVIMEQGERLSTGINVLTIRRDYKIATGVNADIPEAAIMNGLNSLINKGLVLEVTGQNIISNAKPNSAQDRMKKARTTPSNRKTYRINTSNYTIMHLMNVCKASLISPKE